MVIKKKDSPLKLSFEKNENLTKNGEKLKKEEMEKTWEKIKASNNKKNNFITKGQFLKLEKEVADLTLQPKINETSRRMMENVEFSLIKLKNCLFIRNIRKVSLLKID